jgi:hypothetical protein
MSFVSPTPPKALPITPRIRVLTPYPKGGYGHPVTSALVVPPPSKAGTVTTKQEVESPILV